MPSFTARVANLEQVGPVVEVRLAVGRALEAVLQKQGQEVPTALTVRGMIDTGATETVIAQDIPGQLGLKPVGIATITTASSTNVKCYEYLLRIILPNGVTGEAVAIALPLRGRHIYCLLGRDMLRHAVLIYNGYMETFTLSF